VQFDIINIPTTLPDPRSDNSLFLLLAQESNIFSPLASDSGLILSAQLLVFA